MSSRRPARSCDSDEEPPPELEGAPQLGRRLSEPSRPAARASRTALLCGTLAGLITLLNLLSIWPLLQEHALAKVRARQGEKGGGRTPSARSALVPLCAQAQPALYATGPRRLRRRRAPRVSGRRLRHQARYLTSSRRHLTMSRWAPKMRSVGKGRAGLEGSLGSGAAPWTNSTTRRR